MDYDLINGDPFSNQSLDFDPVCVCVIIYTLCLNPHLKLGSEISTIVASVSPLRLEPINGSRHRREAGICKEAIERPELVIVAEPPVSETEGLTAVPGHS